MKIDYERLKLLNIEAILADGNQMSCYYIIQLSIERYVTGDTLTNEAMNFLIDLGILIPTEEDKKKIVEPFNFTGNDRP